jgi:cytochrome P450
MHLLNPDGDRTLLARVMQELETAKNPDGRIDIPKLISLPLYQSVLHETLRLYTDLFVTRELHQDIKLPINDNGQYVLLKKNSLVMAPSYLGHYDDAAWTEPPAEVFYAERFLREDPDTKKLTFSLTGTNGKFFPFGGGRGICPGRVFAKQEVLVGVAMVLSNFDFDVVGFVDEKWKPSKQFPRIRAGYSGPGLVSPGGDVKVVVTRKASNTTKES